MKFQNPSLNSVLNGRKDERTHKPKPICSPLFQSWGHNYQDFSAEIIIFAPEKTFSVMYRRVIIMHPKQRVVSNFEDFFSLTVIKQV